MIEPEQPLEKEIDNYCNYIYEHYKRSTENEIDRLSEMFPQLNEDKKLLDNVEFGLRHEYCFLCLQNLIRFAPSHMRREIRDVLIDLIDKSIELI